MPDTNLRTAVRSALALDAGDTLTQADMENLTELAAKNSEISNITGLESATNLETLDLRDNTISNINAISGLTGLETLKLKGNTLSSITPLSGLTHLTLLNLRETGISSVSALSGLTNLEHLRVDDNSITDVQPLTSLVALEKLWIAGNSLTNAHLLSSLTNLTTIDITIPDPPDTTDPDVEISVPSGTQTGAFDVTITFNESVSGFEQSELDVSGDANASITNWSPNADNTVFTATITPTTSGTVTLDIAADVATDAAGNPNTAATPETVTVTIPAVTQQQGVDTLDPDVGISVPEGVQNGAFDVTITFTEAVSDFVQADLSLGGTATASITDWDTTDDTVFTAEITPTTSGEVTLDIAADVATDAANNGNTAATAQTVSIDVDRPGVTILVEGYKRSGYGDPISPVVGASATLVSVEFTEPVRADEFDPSTILTTSGPTTTIRLLTQRPSEVTGDEQTITLWHLWSYTQTVTESGELTFNIAEGVTRDLAGNSNTAATVTVTADIDPPAISRVTVPAGTQGSEFNMTIEFTEPVSPNHNSKTFWNSDLVISTPEGLSYNATFTNEEVDRTTYILTLAPPDEWQMDQFGRYSNGIWSMEGQIRITAISSGAVIDAARNSNLQQLLSESVSPYVSISTYSEYDMDKDHDVDIDDVRIVVQALGQSGDAITDPRTDIDVDGDVDKDDVLAVIDNVGTFAAAPVSADIFADLSPEIYKALNPILLTETLDAVRLASDGSLKYLQAIVLLEHFLVEMRPDETQLLANYPNPFNPETWIPYHLATPSNVRITIYDVRGVVVRQLDLGHQREGYYTNRSRAAYWDGRNAVGERVASGIYFYQLQADNRSLLRKMLIVK